MQLCNGLKQDLVDLDGLVAATGLESWQGFDVISDNMMDLQSTLEQARLLFQETQRCFIQFDENLPRSKGNSNPVLVNRMERKLVLQRTAVRTIKSKGRTYMSSDDIWDLLAPGKREETHINKFMKDSLKLYEVHKGQMRPYKGNDYYVDEVYLETSDFLKVLTGSELAKGNDLE